MGVIVYNGVSSRDFGIEVAAPPDYEAAEKDYTSIEVPGRNGSLHIDNGRFKNVSRSYECSFAHPGWGFKKRFFTPASAIASWLGTVSGYARLEDTYDDTVYRLARYSGPLTITNLYDMAGTFTLEFDCLPERFLKSGELARETSSGIDMFNPTQFPSKPRIEIFGSGTCNLYVGSQLVIVKLGNYGSATVDSYYQEVYSGTNNLNGNATFINKEFPKMPPGRNHVGFNGNGITKIKITPNWWTL